MLLAVNYHYIGDERFCYPGIHPLSPIVFKEQVETLGRFFEFIDAGELLRAVRGGGDLPRKACMLTFDDGLREQYTRAVPILERLRVPALFFVPGQPYGEGRPLTVHRIHWLRSQMEPAEFHNCITVVCRDTGLSDRLEAAKGSTHGRYFWDDIETRNTKYLLNVLLSDEERALVVDALRERLGLDGEEYFENLYMTREQVKELSEHFSVGTHGYSHNALARLSKRKIEKDIRQSLSVLSEFGCAPEIISYPYGYEGAVSPIVFQVAKACGLRAGFTTERSFNMTLADPLALARVDTNDAPGGKQPLIIPNEDGFDLKGVMSRGRSRYHQE